MNTANPVHVHLDIHVNGAQFGLWTLKGKEKKGQPPVLKKKPALYLMSIHPHTMNGGYAIPPSKHH